VSAMEQRVLGKTGFRVSVLGFGGSEIGSERLKVAKAGRLLNAALDAGLSIIDTAECYDASEELIGSTVAHRRQDYCLVTKCGHASGLDLPEWTPALIERSIDRSLKRLRMDCIDVVSYTVAARRPCAKATRCGAAAGARQGQHAIHRI
jgi:aryl-alcohol dehydrogenase-like predicted oxidoreductase